MISRRNFIKTAALGSAALTSLPHFSAIAQTHQEPELLALSNELVNVWGEKLLSLQITDQAKGDYGGIMCPTYKIVHGRIGDTIYPFFHLAHKKGESKYIDAAMLLYQWMEKHVSQPDGSWLNEPVKGAWKGTTVFSIIALAETIKIHGSIMDTSFKTMLMDRLVKAGDFVHDTFTIDYGNINYPISASYGLSLLGEVLDVNKYKIKGKALAYEALKFITPTDNLLFGEGDPYYEKSKKGCLSVDLGYNVEESLPSLALYGLLTKDEEILQPVIRSMQAHMEFMLPDGGWDNSWGTRNYKWTYWGSRTSDGCQPAYGLLTDRDPRFHKVALRNTQLLKACTHDGLLYGGPHYLSHKVSPSVHHTFCHIKALTTLLDYSPKLNTLKRNIELPREKIYGSKFFSDTQTLLISKGKFRATITTYDCEYKKTKNGHASGGALTMLWHEQAGVLLCASMNAYQLFEAGNMQKDDDPLSMSLTPRIEYRSQQKEYMNISDLNATMEVIHQAGKIIVKTASKLVDESQNNPDSGAITCAITYIFSDDAVMIHYKHDQPNDEEVKIIFPVVSSSNDTVRNITDKEIQIEKETSTVKLSSSASVLLLPTSSGRIFNYVPGLEAIPLSFNENEAQMEIRVKAR